MISKRVSAHPSPITSSSCKTFALCQQVIRRNAKCIVCWPAQNFNKHAFANKSAQTSQLCDSNCLIESWLWWAIQQFCHASSFAAMLWLLVLLTLSCPVCLGKLHSQVQSETMLPVCRGHTGDHLEPATYILGLRPILEGLPSGPGTLADVLTYRWCKVVELYGHSGCNSFYIIYCDRLY